MTKPNHAVLYIIQYISIMKKYAKFCAISVHFLLCQSPQFSFLRLKITGIENTGRKEKAYENVLISLKNVNGYIFSNVK